MVWCYKLRHRTILTGFPDTLRSSRGSFEEAPTCPCDKNDAILQAGTEKIANRTRERKPERRGRILKCTITQRNKRLPADVLMKITQLQRLGWISMGFRAGRVRQVMELVKRKVWV